MVAGEALGLTPRMADAQPLCTYYQKVGFALVGLLAFVDPGTDTPEAKAKQHKIDFASQWITSGSLLLSMVLSWVVFNDVALEGNAYTVQLMRWIQSGDLELNWAFKVDTLTAVMLVVVTTVSAMVHVYSIGYMHHDPDVPIVRFSQQKLEILHVPVERIDVPVIADVVTEVLVRRWIDRHKAAPSI